MRVYPLLYNPIPEECDLVRVYIDQVVAEEQCKLMNDALTDVTRYSLTRYPYIVGQPVDVVE
jgi:hypothetical protein